MPLFEYIKRPSNENAEARVWKSRGRFCIEVLLVAFLFFSIGTANSSLAANKKEKVDENEVFAALQEERCASAWQILLPAITKQDANALFLFLRTQIYFYLRVPGQPIDKLARMRKLLILSVYGFPSNDPEAQDLSFGILDYIAKIGVSDAGRVKGCLKDARNPGALKKCQDLAVKLELVPTISDFLAELTAKHAAQQEFQCRIFEPLLNPLEAPK